MSKRIVATMAASRLLLSPLLTWKWAGVHTRDDVVMGGVSQSQVRIGGDGSLIFEGHLSTQNNGGFCLCRSDLVRSETAVDMRLLEGGTNLVVQARGDGNTYLLRVSNHSNVDGVYYSSAFTTKRGEVTTGSFPLSAMHPSWRGQDMTGRVPPLAKAEELRSVGFMIMAQGGQKGDFQLEVLSVAVEGVPK